MILKQGEPFQIPTKDKKLVQDMFPEFFHPTPAKRKGVQLDYPASSIKMMNGHPIKNPSRGINVEAISVIDGMQCTIRYCEAYRTNKQTGEVDATPSILNFSDREMLKPGVDDDLLYFLALYSDTVGNNLAKNFKKTSPSFEFYLPHLEAQSKLLSIQAVSQAKGLSVDSARFPDENVHELCQAMGIANTENQSVAELRVLLHSVVLNIPEDAKRFLDYMNDNTTMEARSVIQKAVDKRFIRFDTDKHFWIALDADGNKSHDIVRVGQTQNANDTLYRYLIDHADVYKDLRVRATSINQADEIAKKQDELAQREAALELKEKEAALKTKEIAAEKKIIALASEETTLSTGIGVVSGKPQELHKSADYSENPVDKGKFNKYMNSVLFSPEDLEFIFEGEDRKWFLDKKKALLLEA